VDGDLVRRAGYLGNRDVMALRFEQASPAPRSYWRLSEGDQDDGETILGDPLDLRPGGFSISQLPNGLLAFGIEDSYGNRLNSVPICSVLNCPLDHLGSLAACHACHESGLLPVTDMIRSFAEDNANLYDDETLRGVLAQYPGAGAFEQLIATDNQLTRSATEVAGVVRSGPEPISYVVHDFELRSLDLSAVAAELGVPPASFGQPLEEWVPQWQVLTQPGGTIDRYTFLNQYVGALCALHASARNRPVGCL
jgi:hypothetical protein